MAVMQNAATVVQKEEKGCHAALVHTVNRVKDSKPSAPVFRFLEKIFRNSIYINSISFVSQEWADTDETQLLIDK